MSIDYRSLEEMTRATWSLDDYRPLARLLEGAAEAVVDTCGISVDRRRRDIEWFEADAEDLPFEEGRFDTSRRFRGHVRPLSIKGLGRVLIGYRDDDKLQLPVHQTSISVWSYLLFKPDDGYQTDSSVARFR